MKVTFLSPVTPDELLRSSLPYSYMDVEVSSLDNSTHNVQLYTDVSAGGSSPDRDSLKILLNSYRMGIWRSCRNSTMEIRHHSTGLDLASILCSSFRPIVVGCSIIFVASIIFNASVFIVTSSWARPLRFEDSLRNITLPLITTRSLFMLLDKGFIQLPGPSFIMGIRLIRQVERTSTRSVLRILPTHPVELPTTGFGASSNSSSLRSTNKPTGVIGMKDDPHRVDKSLLTIFSYSVRYYATSNTKDLTYQSGADVDVRGQFINNGFLADTQDSDFRGIDDRFPVFGFAVDIGKVSKSSVSTLFQLSLHQDNCIKFEGANGNQSVPCLWTSYFSDEKSAVRHFIHIFPSFFDVF